ncbi:MAG: hypothetical protein IJJ85_07755 [Clostridia bacterium]|nr:hypothetical protein [Clostridia bacterium]
MNNYPCNRNNYLRSRTIHVEAEVEIPGCREVSYATCWLPATEQQLKDFMQRARFHPRMEDYSFHILSCPPVQEIAEMRMDTFSLEELNFLAKRLAVLPETEISAMNALLQNDGIVPYEQMEPVSLRDLINMTYGVEDLPVVADVFSLRDLGEFVIENELHPDIAEIPKDCRYLLDRERIGEMQRDCDDGVIIDGMYVATQDFTMPDVYNGVDLPETDEDKKVVFRLLISQAPYASADETRDSAEWISLPISPKEADRIAGLHGEGHIEDCMLYDMESAIPSLNLNTFNDMMDFRHLNELAGWYLAMSPMEQVKYKAMLEAEPNLDAERALQLAKELPAYELSYYSLSPKEFFRDYVSHFTDNRFDGRWLDEITEPAAAAELLRKLGATQTNYGVVSAYGGQLFTPISRFEDQTEDESAGQTASDEEPDEGMEMRM